MVAATTTTSRGRGMVFVPSRAMSRSKKASLVVSAALVAVLFATSACTIYEGSAHDFDPASFSSQPGWVAIADVPYVAQQRDQDCGLAALTMLLDHWQVQLGDHELELAVPTSEGAGARLGDLRDFAKAKGLKAFVVEGDLADVRKELSKRRPVLVGLVKSTTSGPCAHYEVVAGLHDERHEVAALDPARGWQVDGVDGFLQEWAAAGRPLLVVLPSSSNPSPVRPASVSPESSTAVGLGEPRKDPP